MTAMEQMALECCARFRAQGDDLNLVRLAVRVLEVHPSSMALSSELLSAAERLDYCGEVSAVIERSCRFMERIRIPLPHSFLHLRQVGAARRMMN